MGEPFAIFDPEGIESNLFEEWNSEQTQIGGAPMLYYRIMEGQTKNRYGEVIEKIYEDPIEITASYEDPKVVPEMSRWGVDEKLDLVVNIDTKQVKEKLINAPKRGDKIKLWNGDEFSIQTVIFQDSFLYHRHNYLLTCTRALRDVEQTDQVPDQSPFQFRQQQ